MISNRIWMHYEGRILVIIHFTDKYTHKNVERQGIGIFKDKILHNCASCLWWEVSIIISYRHWFVSWRMNLVIITLLCITYSLKACMLKNVDFSKTAAINQWFDTSKLSSWLIYYMFSESTFGFCLKINSVCLSQTATL